MKIATLQLSKRELKVPFTAQPLAYEALQHSPYSALFVDSAGGLQRINTKTGELKKIAQLPAEMFEPNSFPHITIGHQDRYAAITFQINKNDSVNRGLVVDIQSGATIMTLDVGDYRTGHTQFPIGFFCHAGRELILHGTDWNRLDASDLHTGQIITKRKLDDCPEDDDDDSDCFSEWNGHLSISPDDKHVLVVGWVWHPIGHAFGWSLDAWLNGNIWEAEIGQSKRSYAGWDYFWDSNIQWLDERRIAIWLGDDFQADPSKPHVCIYDFFTTEMLIKIDGPNNYFVIDGSLLFSNSQDDTAVSVWHCESGELLQTFEGERFNAYHHVDREWVQFTQGAWHFVKWKTSTVN